MNLSMLDTDIVSDLLKTPAGRAAQRIAAVGPDAICVSAITAAELRYGCAKKGSAKLLAHVEAIPETVQIPPFDVPADTAYGEIRAGLEAAGKPIGPNDLLIAAHASAADAVRITANTGKCTQATGLQVESWIA